MKDFTTYFKSLRVCSMGPDAFPKDLLESTCPNELMRWWVVVREGTWVAGDSAGGCRNHPGQ